MIVLNDLVLIKPDKEEDSAIVRPDSAKGEPQTGTVIGRGNTVAGIIEINDHVIFRRWAGDMVNKDGTKYIILKEEDVLLIDNEK